MIDRQTRYTARTPGRSFYAALAPAPVVCFVGTLVTDLAYWRTVSVLWETFSVWLLTAGLIMAGATGLAGVIDLVRSRRTRFLAAPAWLHVLGHVVAFGLSLVNVFVHSRDGYTAVVPQGLLLSALVVIVLAATSWIGNAFVDRRRIGAMT